VYHAKNEKGDHVAVKIVPAKHFGHGEHEAASALDRFRCEYIVKFKTIVKIDKDYIISMEYANHKSLENLIKTRKTLSEEESSYYVEQLLKGVSVIHEANLLHRDIKPENILLHLPDSQSRPIVKISDFGLAKLLDKDGLAETQCGTPLYMAPEIYLENKKFDQKADVWSVGVIFYRLLSGQLPFPARSASQLMQMLRKPPPRLNQVTYPCWDLVIGMLNSSPARRLSC
ncbi:MAG: putative serine/threonine-protein kinase, partial [Streblomastix strix]